MTASAPRVARWLSVLWLAVVWVLLWGSFTLLTILGGVLVGVAVTALFRTATPPNPLPLRPVRLLALLGFVARDLVVSSYGVSFQTLRYGPRARGAILELPLLTSSDRVVAVIAGAYTLSPGTIVLQIDHVSGLWYIYVLGPRDARQIEEARTSALEMQRRVLSAFGTPDEIAEARRMLLGRRGAP
ncbi:MAG: Na+/H+ antiporter subunit E [Pseudonocardia sp.]|nr:Na+/H+ antiporter subunit E [Pseudonocardia sp.]